MTIIAHQTEKEHRIIKQSLFDHLSGVNYLAHEGSEILPKCLELISYTHDIGKASDEAQQRMRGGSIKVNHATAGGKFIIEKTGQNYVGLSLAWPCVCHHGGLLNRDNDKTNIRATSAFITKLKSVIPDCQNHLPMEIQHTINELWNPAFRELQKWCSNSLEKGNDSYVSIENGFRLAFLIRMLFSSLVDADFIDTETFFDGAKRNFHFPSFNEMSAKMDKRIEFYNQSPQGLNRWRTAVLNECVEKADLPKGLFTLSAPTGSGKTEASLAFALKHVQKNNLRRIIYGVPYNTITTQCCQTYRDILGGEAILEHHSEYTFKEGDENEDQNNRHRLLTENWQAPFIVTSTVQLFESLFTAGNSKARKLHNIQNSLIILDEAQLLPIKLLKPTLLAIRELTEHYNCSILMMTATNPGFPELLSGFESIELLDDPLFYRERFKKAEFESIGTVEIEDLADQLRNKKQVLCIVNTKKAAADLYNRISDKDGIYYLTTNLCPVDRSAIIRHIHTDLDADRDCRVIATSLVEAGVDLDFPVVYREIAGLDSIIQAGGRCNREGKLRDSSGDLMFGKTIIFRFDSENYPLPSYIKTEAAIASRYVTDWDLNDYECLSSYFSELYNLKDLDDKKILGLSTLSNVTSNGRLDIAFKEIADRYKIIGNETYPIIVPKHSAEPILEEFKRNPTRELIRRLQPYTVNVYPNTLRQLTDNNLLDRAFDDGSNIFVLNNIDYYSESIGLLLDIDNTYLF